MSTDAKRSMSQARPPRALHRRPRILFVAQDDGSYSQIAKAYMREIGPDVVEVSSAGLRTSSLDPQVAAVMAEDGCDIRRETPRLVSREVLTWADLVVTLAPNGERVGVGIPGSAHHKHWRLRHGLPHLPVEDLTPYRACRDEIKRRIDQTVHNIRLFRGH